MFSLYIISDDAPLALLLLQNRLIFVAMQFFDWRHVSDAEANLSEIAWRAFCALVQNFVKQQ